MQLTSLLSIGKVAACTTLAEVVKLVDTLASGASGGNPVEVQVLSSAPLISVQYHPPLYSYKTLFGKPFFLLK